MNAMIVDVLKFIIRHILFVPRFAWERDFEFLWDPCNVTLNASVMQR